MRLRAILAATIVVVGGVAFAVGAAHARDVTVFAAASLKTALDEITETFEAATGIDVTLVYAGTSAIVRQIQQGAPADIVISANPDWMDILENDGLIVPATRFDLVGNALVLVAHGDNAARIDDLAAFPAILGERRLAMALVDAVPAGMYGKAALQELGIWDDVSGQVVQSDNVRTALALVALGEVEFGVVYATDAAAEPRVTRVAAFPSDLHPPIVYPAALVDGAAPDRARAFLDAVTSDEAWGVFQSYGFIRRGD